MVSGANGCMEGIWSGYDIFIEHSRTQHIATISCWPFCLSRHAEHGQCHKAERISIQVSLLDNYAELAKPDGKWTRAPLGSGTPHPTPMSGISI